MNKYDKCKKNVWEKMREYCINWIDEGNRDIYCGYYCQLKDRCTFETCPLIKNVNCVEEK